VKLLKNIIETKINNGKKLFKKFEKWKTVTSSKFNLIHFHFSNAPETSENSSPEYDEALKIVTEVFQYENLKNPLDNKAYSNVDNWEMAARNLGMSATKLKRLYGQKIIRYRKALVKNRIYLSNLFAPIKEFLQKDNVVFLYFPRRLDDEQQEYFKILS